jgi:type II secretory pathway component GspD/PulD (secretin)
LLFEHSLSAAGPAIRLSPQAIKALSEAVSDENWLVINPSSTNSVLHDAPIVGPTNITELEEMLHLYADSTGRIVLWPRNLSVAGLDFTADKSLTHRETISALDALFARKGIGLIDVGEKWVTVLSSAGCQTSADSTRQTNYLVHVRHVTYVNPSDLVPILQPFSSGVANAILLIDSDRVLVLRDLPEHLGRMKEVIQEVDVAPPTEFISEVIPIKYAKASEIAAALKKRNGINISADRNLISDERTNSLLIYAGREDMKKIKEIISHLDIVAAQILIEAVIIEINRDKSSKFSTIDNDKIPWMTNFISNVTNAPPPTTPAPSIKSAQVAGFYRFAAISNDLDSFITTLASNTRARILQRPRIQTSDKEPAQLFVGEARQFPDEAYYSGGVTCGYSSIQMVNLGVTLELTPSITNDQLLALGIHQTIEEVNGSVTIANVGDVPITRRSERNAKITVHDRGLVLLDGSIARDNTPPRPGKLKRVLTLNALFHHSKSVTNQNEFIVLIRPTILPTAGSRSPIIQSRKRQNAGSQTRPN